MKKQENNQPESGSLDRIVDQIIALVDVERIYVQKHEKEETCHTVLTILIANTCTKSPAELLPLVSILFTEQHTLHFTLHPAHQIKDALSKGNLYFYNICTEDNLLYRTAGSDYELLPTSLNQKEMLENARKQYDSEEEKIKAFVSGADFYLEKENYAQSAFMLHQAIELNYRAIEHFITGRSKITHSIKAHQKYLEPYCIELSNIFLVDRERDIELLRLLDDAYLAVRYENDYQINKLDLTALRVKASEVKLAALKTYQQLQLNFQQPQTLIKLPETIEQTYQKFDDSCVPLCLIEQICVNIDVERIFCFGKRTYQASRYNPFNNISAEQTEKNHYDLVVISSDERVEKASNLQDKLNNSSSNGYTVLLLMHTDQSLQKFLNSNSRFFHNLLQLGVQVYHKERLTAKPVLPESDPSNTTWNYQMHWHQRYYRGKAFIEAAGSAWDEGEETVVLSLLNQGVEQLCIGLIDAFLGYRPNQHSLSHLFDLCFNFTPLIETIFPRHTSEDLRIFRLLAKSVNNGRHLVNLSIDPTDTGLLYRKCKILIEESESLVAEQLDKL
ncbi:HEPN domain-containing protein [Dyadobacter frigoris]|uniref:HEPN domain-containing protein n=1 Tax=Dyadobacter frigoris TaxID=2576211 RepID=A0A4U6CV45_9BACT|nr:HEPN domain-containing protein [Dyadobacter frigoris]TKT88610.1 HEPN domain-containing protein [Dyadobacter frigoris]GLU54943.1 hypothetical protein Dfri01_44040 [Dyadobacter frigoris]